MCESLDQDEHSIGNYTLVVEEKEYVVPVGWLMVSQLIKNVLDNDPTSERLTLTLPSQVKNAERTMGYLLSYLEYHFTNGPAPAIAKPLKGENLKSSGVGDWDVSFIDKTDEELVELSCTANYLDIPPLLALSCAKIGSIMKSIINKHNNKEDQMKAVRERWFGVDAPSAVV